MIGLHWWYAVENKVIGFVGYARSGKNVAAGVLADEFGYKEFAFADKLRECLYALNPLVISNDGLTTEFLQNIINDYGWQDYKCSSYSDDIRRLTQRFGTDVGRNLLDPDIWVKELDKESGKIVVTDVRFPNELERILASGGKAIRIVRGKPINNHISEVALDDYDLPTIYNNSGIQELQNAVRSLAKEWNL